MGFIGAVVRQEVLHSRMHCTEDVARSQGPNRRLVLHPVPHPPFLSLTASFLSQRWVKRKSENPSPNKNVSSTVGEGAKCQTAVDPPALAREK